MENRKIIIDREKISQKEIKERSDFNNLMNQLQHAPNPFWKTTGFWGVTRLASLLIAFMLPQLFTENLVLDEQFSEFKQNEQIVISKNTGLPSDTKCFQPISNNNDIPFVEHYIEAGKDTSLTLEDGSIIRIPANALETEGEVLIKTRLFPDKASAFLAGIPMDYGNSAFESAGMIEIRGEQDGQPITINSNNPIQVALTAYKDPTEFGFYSLDDQTGEWEDYPCEMVVSNANTQKQISKVEADLKDIATNIERVTEYQENVFFPTKQDFNLASKNGEIFDLDFNEKDYPELKSLGDIKFEIVDKNKKTPSLFTQKWEDVKLKKDGELWTAVFTGNNNHLNIKVRPVLTGKEAIQAFNEYEEAIALAEQKTQELLLEKQALLVEQEKKQAHLNQLIKNKTDEAQHFEASRYVTEEENEASANYTYTPKRKIIPVPPMERTKKFYLDEFVGAVFAVVSFGAFNIDRPNRYPKPLELATQFEVQNEGVKKPENIFVFDLKKDVRYTFGPYNHKLNEFGYNNDKSVVLCTFEDGTVAIGNTKEIRRSESQNKLLLTPIATEDLSLEAVQSFLQEKRVSV